MQKLLALTIVALCATPVFAQWECDTFNVTVTGSEVRRESESTYHFGWAANTQVHRDAGDCQWQLQAKSKYRRDVNGRIEQDRLRFWGRYLLPQQGKLRPLAVISTDGDHALDSVDTVVSAGYRLGLKRGWVELTLGAAKDLKTSDPWVGDIGVTYEYRQSWNKLSMGIRPNARVASFGEVHARPNVVKYSAELSLRYHLSDHFGLNYQVDVNNRSGTQERHQMFGVAYTH